MPAAGPPIAARSFNSEVLSYVWVVREEGGAPETVGHTPAEKPIEIPACWAWGVEPPYGADMRAVVQEMAAQNIPGLRIHSARDDDLAHLENLKGLQWLNIRCSSAVTDAGLSHLKELKGLQTLYLYYTTKITDAGLAQITELKGLQRLHLVHTLVTDAGLVHLKELKGLQRLYLYDTKVTAAGVEEFKRAMPNVNVVR